MRCHDAMCRRRKQLWLFTGWRWHPSQAEVQEREGPRTPTLCAHRAFDVGDTTAGRSAESRGRNKGVLLGSFPLTPEWLTGKWPQGCSGAATADWECKELGSTFQWNWEVFRALLLSLAEKGAQTTRTASTVKNLCPPNNPQQVSMTTSGCLHHCFCERHAQKCCPEADVHRCRDAQSHTALECTRV
jgi:hypothetical protein